MTAYPVDHRGFIRREQALRRDISDDQIAAAVRRGDLRRLAPGITVENSDKYDGADGRDQLARDTAIAVATSEVDRGVSVLSHESAAAVHGLSMLHPIHNKVHFTRAGASGGFVRGERHVHAAPLDASELVEVEGITLTSIERTAVDVATGGSFAQALTVFDSALANKADRELMNTILGSRRRRGRRVARRALAHADRLAGSVGESWSRAQIIDAGLPIPRLQHRFECGSSVYFTDFDWDGRVVGEFDGLQKYGKYLRQGERPGDAVAREKHREDGIRALGVDVARWTWTVLRAGELDDLLRPRLIRAGLIRAGVIRS